MSNDSAMQNAVETYLARTKGREQPQGKRDRKGRWHPTRGERLPCCKLLRPPTVDDPERWLKHCCSIEHVARLYGVHPPELAKQAVDKLDRSEQAPDAPPSE